MKRLTLCVLLCSIIACLSPSLVLADSEKFPLTATASSYYSNMAYYAPGNTVDGNMGNYWIGERYQSPWWIMFDAGDTCYMDYINLYWYTSTSYIPKNYDIQISTDGLEWEDVFTGIEAAITETKQIGREARYIRLWIRSVIYSFPVLKEFEMYGSQEPPVLPTINFQATLKDTADMPLNGQYTFTFKLYEAEAEGEPIWEETQPDTTIEDGNLKVELGSITPLNVPFDKQYWLSIAVESDEEMTPRFKLATVPYSIASKN